jgi:methionyl-tRNA formyltransferase
MRVVCCGYRAWALEIFAGIAHLAHEFTVVRLEEDATAAALAALRPDIILFYGWSRIIERDVLQLAPCICLHPSRLPQFRGGSPLQNQIIRGITDSAVTLFRMTEKLDQGDIVLQRPLSLAGHLDEIFERMTEVSIAMTIEMLSQPLHATPQDHSAATYFRRRTPEMSELTLEDLRTKTARELYDFIRALEDPYPNAFIRCRDGKRLLIKRAEIEPDALESVNVRRE